MPLDGADFSDVGIVRQELQRTDAIGAAFTRAVALLGIEDLHFHDLRHEGASRLFELGMNVPHVAAVSGHRSWNSLRRRLRARRPKKS